MLLSLLTDRRIPRALRLLAWSRSFLSRRRRCSLSQQFEILGLNVSRIANADGTMSDAILDRAWCEYFDALRGSKDPQAQCFCAWVWRLNKEPLRFILDGLRRADGAEAVNESTIYTQSVHFRDELMRVSMHAGYSPIFRLMDTDSKDADPLNAVPAIAIWAVSYRSAEGHIAPTLNRSQAIKVMRGKGPTWCVTVPNGLLYARRAHVDEFGVVTKASVPIVVGNCKAGKGRTGFIICCWLLYAGFFPSYTHELALRFYAVKRTKNQKGVTIPSQIRYVAYFARWLRMERGISKFPVIPPRNPVLLQSIRLMGIPPASKGKDLWFKLVAADGKYSSKGRITPVRRVAEDYVFFQGSQSSVGIASLDQDVHITFFVGGMFDTNKLFAFWFNTRMIGMMDGNENSEQEVEVRPHTTRCDVTHASTTTARRAR
jgi:hypothetical protein